MLRVTVLTVVAGVAPLAAQAAPATSPFGAVAHFDDPQFAADAKSALDAVWALATTLFGAPADAVPPMQVHCYRDHAEYAAAAAALGGPDPKVFPGFADLDTMTAHFYVGAAVRDADGAVAAWVRSGMVHEAMHLAVRAICGRPMGWYPRWFVEGTAMWAERQIVTAGDGAEVGDDDEGTEDAENAASARRMRELLSVARVAVLHRDGRIPPATELLAGKSGNLSQPDEYPVFRLLFELLMTEHADAMVAVLRDSLALPATPVVPA